MRLGSIILFVALCSFSAYYVYEPIPEDIDERWKLMMTNTFFRSLSHLADFSELLGLKDYMGVMYFITLIETIVPVSDEHVNVTVENFDGVEVVLYQPMQQSGNTELRRAVIYLHGGGWCLGSAYMSPYDLLARKVATELNAVVLSVEYRLAVAHHFPVPYEDVYRVVKSFLQMGVLAQYSVDPGRIAVSGDSAGGNLAAAVSQQLLKDPTQKVQLKAQALLYPVLQALDLNTPSYQQNQDMPILPRTLMVRFWSEYFTSDKAFFRAMMANAHNSLESSSLLKFVNWSAFLPEMYHRKYNYSVPAVLQGKAGQSFGTDGPSRSLADPRASPLLVPDAALHSLPKAYILTCEYDVLRDDGLMYVTRLRAAGVDVTHEHYDSGFHGSLMFTVWPMDFRIGHRMMDNYLKWLKENL
ncbi:arylacetamide deacetylase [Hippocampus comes]|uniref:Arylacetamide deacetylase n=1 Tax=Hippocampus comes TaxID=109280 RepID=A0A3Q3D4V1_HIPCM|nr:PREDICTED: arylacetamide deacetylase-like [Hippocampus comes]